jgi:hypothetical protein
MVIPDYPAESRQIRIVDQDNATVISAPYELTPFGLKFVFTEYAISHRKNVNENGT